MAIREWPFFGRNSPIVTKITCATGAPTGDVPIDPSLRSTGLFYDAPDQAIPLIWKPPTSYAGSCQTSQLKFFDGTTYSALFNFK